MRCLRIFGWIFSLSLMMLSTAPQARAQAALLMEEPYGFFGALNPTGHTALYFAHICAETPVKLRRCRNDETGVVLSRYQGIGDYDWIAIPLVPYLYAVEWAEDAPLHVDRELVRTLRNQYHERHLMMLGEHIPEGSLYHGGWTELVGVAYERRIYAFRFDTTQQQEDALIARLNGVPNNSRFDLLVNNCADWARKILNMFYPGKFKRTLFPDAGLTTPKQIAFKLVRLGRKHPEMHLRVFAIEQIPGYRRRSHGNKNISESLATTAYAVPIALLNPYIAGGLIVDSALRSRGRIVPKDAPHLLPATLSELASDERNPVLTAAGTRAENANDVGAHTEDAEKMRAGNEEKSEDHE